MLVVISDLHFVDGTSGNHNLPSAAFEKVFLSSIVSLAKKNKATELKLLLLGDIPDLIRSTQWFEEGMADRLWGENGLADIPQPQPGSKTEQRCLDILGRFPDSGNEKDVPEHSILRQNWRTFDFFRNFHKHVHDAMEKKIPVEMIYLIGNHDRPLNLYPAVRDEFRKIFGLTVTPETVDGDPDGEWWYKLAYQNDAYGVFARHGHQFDVFNYNGTDDWTREDHLQVPIGDIVATEIAVNLAYTLKSMQADHPEISDELVRAMQDADNVRPVGRLMEWFYSKMNEQDDDAIREALDETIDKVARNFLEIDFVRQWRNPDTLVDELLRTAASTPFKKVINFFMDHTDANDLLRFLLPFAERRLNQAGIDDFTRGAFDEEVWRQEESDIRYVLYGHTHTPLIKPLDRVNGRDVLYLNTGTWRERLTRTVSLDKTADFVGLKQLTYLVFYNEDEDKKGKELGTIGFDSWTGHQQKQYAKEQDKHAADLSPKEDAAE